MPKGAKLERKNAYMAKLVDYLETKPMALMVGVDFVGSKQMQEIRAALRKKCIVLMGKNTMIRTALRKRIEETEDEGLSNLLQNVQGNFGFVFLESTSHLEEAREVISGNKVPAAAKAGVVAPKDVFIQGGNTGLEPSATSFFQALNIPTKIVKGNIEIVSEVHLIKKGDKCSLSAVALLNKLGLKPFEYGMEIQKVYQDSCVFDAAVLDITDAVLAQKFMQGASNVAAFGRQIGIPTEAGLPHMLTAAFKNMVATVLDVDFPFEQADEIKTILSDPEAMAKMQAAAASTGGAAAGGDAGAAAAAAAPVEEEEEEEMDFDLFD